MDTVTITREEFRDIVNKCNNDFMITVSKFDESLEHQIQTYAMSLQNTTFAAYVEYELFKEKEGN